MTLPTPLAAVLLACVVSCSGADDLAQAEAALATAGATAAAAAAPLNDSAATFFDPRAPEPDTRALDSASVAREDSLYQAAAEMAWAFVDRNHVTATGLVRPFDTYPVATMWDVASGVAAHFSAFELGLLEREEYDRRMTQMLATLEALPLFEDIGFNKEYDVTTGRPIGLSRRPSTRGYGISATDHGRLLLWLGIIAHRHPRHRDAATRVAQRLDLRRFASNGYLSGRQVSRRTGRTREFQEGRIGYEQYAARGFATWGLVAHKAGDIDANRTGRKVDGVELPADKRGRDRLTSEPFILLGMEAGWSQAERAAALAVLAAQEARYARTGTLTMVSEDAINRAPDYFFYYTLLSPHGEWSIDVQRPNTRVTGPRWVSTKAAFAWHALAPRAYTQRVVEQVATKAVTGRVWGSGVFENGRPTGNANLNTAAVVLEAALYRAVRSPFLLLPEAR